ncbi:hypothetical protein MKW98_026919, partial [Papaver atlanticum]
RFSSQRNKSRKFKDEKKKRGSANTKTSSSPFRISDQADLFLEARGTFGRKIGDSGRDIDLELLTIVGVTLLLVE